MVISDIKQTIPHREPFLFLENVHFLKIGEYVEAGLRKEALDSICTGHFPGNAVVPGVILIEAMAQAACYLFIKSILPARDSVYYMGFVKIRFHENSKPTDSINLKATSEKMFSKSALFFCEAMIGGKIIASGQIGVVCKSGSE